MMRDMTSFTKPLVNHSNSTTLSRQWININIMFITKIVLLFKLENLGVPLQMTKVLLILYYYLNWKIFQCVIRNDKRILEYTVEVERHTQVQISRRSIDQLIFGYFLVTHQQEEFNLNNIIDFITKNTHDFSPDILSVKFYLANLKQRTETK